MATLDTISILGLSCIFLHHRRVRNYLFMFTKENIALLKRVNDSSNDYFHVPFKIILRFFSKIQSFAISYNPLLISLFSIFMFISFSPFRVK